MPQVLIKDGDSKSFNCFVVLGDFFLSSFFLWAVENPIEKVSLPVLRILSSETSVLRVLFSWFWNRIDFLLQCCILLSLVTSLLGISTQCIIIQTSEGGI